MPVNFTTIQGQRVNLNCDPGSYTYAIASENGVVRIKYPDVPEFEIYQRDQDLALQAEEAEAASRLKGHLDDVVQILKGKKRSGGHSMFHTLFMPGDIWKVVKVSWYEEDTRFYDNHFYGLKPGDEFVISKAGWENGYYGCTKSDHPGFDKKKLAKHLRREVTVDDIRIEKGVSDSGVPLLGNSARSSSKSVVVSHASQPTTHTKEPDTVFLLDPHNVTEGHVVFMGNSSVDEPRWFGNDITGRIYLPIGKRLSVPKSVTKALKELTVDQQLSLPHAQSVGSGLIC
jgi:hypothetical protein